MKLSHVVEGLLPDRQYAFCVRPINAVAMGPRGVFTDPVRCVPGAAALLERPTSRAGLHGQGDGREACQAHA
jgi:hypothetical protein